MISQTACCHRFCDSRWSPRRFRRAHGRHGPPVFLRNSFPAILILLVLTFVLMIRGGFARKGRTCGVDALYQICLHYNLPIQYEEVYAACKPNDEGNSMYELFQAAQELGFSATAMRLCYEELLTQDSPPIAFVNGNLFVAVVGHEGDKIDVVDYPEPSKLYSQDDVEEICRGAASVTSRDEEPQTHDVHLAASTIQSEHTMDAERSHWFERWRDRNEKYLLPYLLFAGHLASHVTLFCGYPGIWQVRTTRCIIID